ncbi:uncharacterized protein [Vicugna pacos]|uniref:Uncharacterized protein n=1 Tax=Vicugna pacos TaxID=30538 RepID=A0ABM5CXW9_VICPA
MASLQLRRQGPWTRSWRRELRNFLKSTLALRMILQGSARSNMSHECLLSLVSSTAVSTPVFSMVAEHLSSMCSHLSSIRAASFSASFSSCLPLSRLHQDSASRKVPRSLTSKLITGRSSTVCPFRFWKLTCELRSLGSSSISNLHSFPDQTPKPSSTDGGSPSITLIHPQNSARLPRIQQPQQASRCTPTFHLESNQYLPSPMAAASCQSYGRGCIRPEVPKTSGTLDPFLEKGIEELPQVHVGTPYVSARISEVQYVS